MSYYIIYIVKFPNYVIGKLIYLSIYEFLSISISYTIAALISYFIFKNFKERKILYFCIIGISLELRWCFEIDYVNNLFIPIFFSPFLSIFLYHDKA